MGSKRKARLIVAVAGLLTYYLYRAGHANLESVSMADIPGAYRTQILSGGEHEILTITADGHFKQEFRDSLGRIESNAGMWRASAEGRELRILFMDYQQFIGGRGMPAVTSAYVQKGRFGVDLLWPLMLHRDRQEVILRMEEDWWYSRAVSN